MATAIDNGIESAFDPTRFCKWCGFSNLVQNSVNWEINQSCYENKVLGAPGHVVDQSPPWSNWACRSRLAWRHCGSTPACSSSKDGRRRRKLKRFPPRRPTDSILIPPIRAVRRFGYAQWRIEDRAVQFPARPEISQHIKRRDDQCSVFIVDSCRQDRLVCPGTVIGSRG